jgi:hypothetical protein
VSSPVPFNDAKARIQAANLGVPVSWPNTVFRKPSPPGPWLSVDITSHVLAPIELSGGMWQEEGTLYVDVFVPNGTGSDAARTLAKNVSNLFRGQYSGPIIYNGGSIGNGTITEQDGMWWVITVTVAWRYQDST